MVNIQVNDLIHARLENSETRSVAVQEFRVTAISGTSYEGGPLPCDTADGWVVEVSRKDFANLNLPTTISEITVIDISNNEHQLTGKNDVWRDATGQFFDVNLIIDWREGHGINPLILQSLQAIAEQTDSGQI
jgi:hypothetical protein